MAQLRFSALGLLVPVLAFSAMACGAKGTNKDDDPSTLPPEDTSVSGDETDALTDSGPATDTEFNLDVPPPCVGLKCKQVKCPDGLDTTVTGVVYDPAGKLPLYNVIVYVPNAPVDPLVKGASCDKCGAIASGSPITTALTDSKGRFTLKNVPADDNVPLVIQLGKWRRQVKIAKVTACENTSVGKELTRLPKKQSEGDLPKMAITTGGCDPLECLFRKIGIDDTEFTNDTGKGSMHMYKGQGGGDAPTGSTPAMTFWSSLTTLKKYDITILSCECSEYPTNKPPEAVKAMHDYASAGGRIFATHYHYYWMKSGPADFNSTATWAPGGTGSTLPYSIDTTFPKGKAFNDWLLNVGAITTSGQITMSSVANDVQTVNKATSQRWIYLPPATGTEAVKYLSFNTPVGKPAESQCGRVVFSDLHVANGEMSGKVFPTGCNPSLELTPQEKALEFLFFDLSACLQKDDEVPIAPPPK